MTRPFRILQPEFCHDFKKCPHHIYINYDKKKIPKHPFFHTCQLDTALGNPLFRKCIYQEEYQTWALLK